MVRQLRVILLTLGASVLLGSCLSLEVTIDISDPTEYLLTYRYHVSSEVWRLGVFDEDSPERAIPISRRDAEETALLHPGVRLVRHEVSESTDRTVVEIEYAIESPDALAAVWAGDSPGAPRLEVTDGTIRLPLALGGTEPDELQRDLIARAFAGESLSVTVVAPGPIETIDAGSGGESEIDGRSATYSRGFADLLSDPDGAWLTMSWSDG